MISVCFAINLPILLKESRIAVDYLFLFIDDFISVFKQNGRLSLRWGSTQFKKKTIVSDHAFSIAIYSFVSHTLIAFTSYVINVNVSVAIFIMECLGESYSIGWKQLNSFFVIILVLFICNINSIWWIIEIKFFVQNEMTESSLALPCYPTTKYHLIKFHRKFQIRCKYTQQKLVIHVIEKYHP